MHPRLNHFLPSARFLAVVTGVVILLTSACIGTAAVQVEAQASRNVHGEEWRTYGGDSNGQRYSPLAAINPRTVAKLGMKWALDLPNETALVSTPLYVGGMLFFTGKFSVVYAVDAKSGILVWTYDPATREVLAREHSKNQYNMGTSRGLAYWNSKLYVAPADGRLIAISARTGNALWTVQTFDPVTPRNITGAPLAFNGKVLIGHGGGDTGPMRGYVTAYDAETGRQLWRFYTVPGNPADGFESNAMRAAATTWTGEWWKLGGGGAVWNSMTFDAELNRVYIGTGNGSPWNHRVRSPLGGDNLYLASIVALDADSGTYIWHYQETPGDDWDFDATDDIVLAEITIRGRPRKVLMQASKNGFFYVIDRQSGKLVSAESFVPTTWAKGVDQVTGRPVEELGVRPEAGKPGVTIRPSAIGGHSWPSTSYSPDTGLMYIPALEYDEYYSARDIDPKRWSEAPFWTWYGYSDVLGRELAPPPTTIVSGRNETTDFYGNDPSAWLQARDPRSNVTVWKAKQPGRWAGGTLATRGGLVFIGQANGNLAAYDSRSGQELWSFNAGRPITASPISYSVNGAQYVSVLVGWGGFPGAEGAAGDPKVQMGYRDGGRRLLTFALGGNARLPITPSVPAEPIDVPDFVVIPEKVARGEEIFDRTCNNCHGTNLFSGGMAPDLRASRLASDRNALRAVIFGALELRGMPKYYDLSEQDVDSIYHYIRFQARQDLSEKRRSATPPDH